MLRRVASRSLPLWQSASTACSQLSDLTSSSSTLLSTSSSQPALSQPSSSQSNLSLLCLPIPSGSAFQSARNASSWAFWRRGSESASQPPASSQLVLEDETTSVAPVSQDHDQVLDAAQSEYFPLAETATESFLAINQACDAIERASIAAAKADAFFSAAWFMSAFEYVHTDLGLPWWGTIAAVNITTRVLAFPLMVLSQKATAKMVSFNHKLLHAKKLQEALVQAKDVDEQMRLKQAFQAEYQKVFATHGNPMYTALTIPATMFGNAAIFISIFSAVSKLMESKAPSLTVGGMLWFKDLTVVDPYYGLPLLCCMTTLAMVEYGISMSGDEMSGSMERAKQAAFLKWLMRSMSLMFLPAGMYVSAGTATLWVSNSCFAVVQGIAMRQAAVRQMCGLPSMEEMRKMNQEVAAANQRSQPVSPAPGAIPMNVPVDPISGQPQLLKNPPRPVKKPGHRAPPPPGTKARA